MRGLSVRGGLVFALLAGLLVGCGGGGGGGGPTGSLFVLATVVDYLGVPQANIAVAIDGQGPLISDASGHVQASGVRVPYDAITFGTLSAPTTVYAGLTRPDPTLVIGINLGSMTMPAQADVSGTVTGGAGFPEPLNHQTDVIVNVDDLFGQGSDEADTTTGAYDRPGFSWYGGFGGTLRVSALQWINGPTGVPISFTGYGTTTAPVTAGDTITGMNVAMVPVITTFAGGTIVAPPPYSFFFGAIVVRGPGGWFEFLSGDPSGSPSFTLFAPDAPGLTRTLLAGAIAPDGTQAFALLPDLPAPAAGLMVDVPAGSNLAFPPPGITNVGYGTVFQVTPNPGDRVFSVSFSPTSAPGTPITLITTSSSFRVPDLRSWGLGFLPGEQYSWSIDAFGPMTSVDDYAVPQSLLFFIPVPDIGPVFFSSSATWDFTFGS